MFPAHARLPTELCEHIIDWVAARYDPDDWNWKIQRTLSACALVCRAWLHRARMHLYSRITLQSGSLSRLECTLRAACHISSFITELKIDNFNDSKTISSFFITYKPPNLKTLYISGLDLTREHIWLSRASLCHSVRNLNLVDLQECKVSQFIHFINCFHSLSSLRMDFHLAFNNLKYNGQILPKPSHILSSCSLTSLNLELIPGISRLLDWCLKAGSFLKHISKLTLQCWTHYNKSEFCSCFGGIENLLHHSSTTIEDLTLHFGYVPLIYDISDLCKLTIYYWLN